MTNNPSPDAASLAPKLSALLERVEGATGGDADLDADIEVLLDSQVEGISTGLKPYTSSIDAALALVERTSPLPLWHVFNGEMGAYGATLFEYDGPGATAFKGIGATPALALLAALLRALSSNPGADLSSSDTGEKQRMDTNTSIPSGEGSRWPTSLSSSGCSERRCSCGSAT